MKCLLNLYKRVFSHSRTHSPSCCWSHESGSRRPFPPRLHSQRSQSQNLQSKYTRITNMTLLSQNLNIEHVYFAQSNPGIDFPLYFLISCSLFCSVYICSYIQAILSRDYLFTCCTYLSYSIPPTHLSLTLTHNHRLRPPFLSQVRDGLTSELLTRLHGL